MLKQPHIEPHPTKSGVFILIDDFSYEWFKEGKRYQLNEFAGFEFDLASVPWLARAITGFTPSSFKWTPPFWHDAGYEYKGRFPPGHFRIWDEDLQGWVNLDQEWKRSQVDKLFCRLMREDGVGRWKRRMAYRAVRLGGWVAWYT